MELEARRGAAERGRLCGGPREVCLLGVDRSGSVCECAGGRRHAGAVVAVVRTCSQGTLVLLPGVGLSRVAGSVFEDLHGRVPGIFEAPLRFGVVT